MSNQIKLRSTQPSNNIRGGIDGLPTSRVYQEKTNQILPLETLSLSNDVKISLNNVAIHSKPVVRIPPQYKFITKAILEVTLAQDVPNTNAVDYLLHNFIKKFSYRFSGCERMDLEPFSVITDTLNDIDDVFKREAYRELNGRAFKKYSAGTKLYMILPIPGIDLTMEPRWKSFPVPLHLTSEPLEITFNFGDEIQLSGADIHLVYGDLAYANEYKNTVYRYNFKAKYGYTFPISGVSTRKAKRSVNLLGLRPGETNQITVQYCPRPIVTDALPIAGTSGATTFPDFWALREGIINQQNFAYGSRLRSLKLYYLSTLIWDLSDKSYEFFDIFQSKKESKFSDWYGFVDDVSYTVSGATTSIIDATAHPNGHNSGLFGSSIRVNAVADGAKKTNNKLTTNSTVGFSRDDKTPYQMGSYYYKIPIAELLSELTKNGYSLGADFTHAGLRLEFVVDSADDDTVVAPLAISHAHAEDLSAGDLYVTQDVQSIYQFMGSTVTLVQ